MKILLTGGGTLGSVTPLLAIVEAWRKRDTKVEFVWIGTQKGPERELVQENYQIPFHPIPVARLPRYLSKELLKLPFNFLKAVFIAFQIIKSEKPDVVIGAGGFTQVPVISSAWILQIKCFTLQTDAKLLLATKLVIPFVKKLFSSHNFGIPVRESILKGSKEKAVARFHLNENKPTVFVFGGGTGAKLLNEKIYEIAPQLSRDFNVLHLTGVGKRVELAPIDGYIVVDALREEMADAYAVADLVIARAGIGTIAELSALGKPCILIPIPKSMQEENVRLLGEAALVLDQEKTTSVLLLDEIRSLLADKIRLQQYKDRIKNILRTNVADDIIEIIIGSN